MYVFTNKRSKQLCEMIIVDAAYYANWLSEVYDLKDRMLEKLLVFSLKIEDLTFLTLICLSTEGKVKNSSHLFRKLRFAKIRHIGDYFADSSCKIRDGFTDFGVGSCVLQWLESCLFCEQDFCVFCSQKKESRQI